MMTNITAQHIDISREFLEKAQRYLAEGDLHQAAEKGWGAAAHMAKAVAATRGWVYDRHDDFHGVMRRARGRVGERNFWDWASAALTLHTLFYNPRTELDADAIHYYLEQVERLLDALQPLTNTP